ncbi:hypothetical protein WMF37_05870 [Sorangium sp. So ce291]
MRRGRGFFYGIVSDARSYADDLDTWVLGLTCRMNALNCAGAHTHGSR